jgi:hypothetical protein
MAKALCEPQKSWFEDWKLARFRDGFVIGIFVALVLHLGIINITTSMQKAILVILLFVGIGISINQAFRKKSLISPPWDGFISGFGTLVAIIELLLPQSSILYFLI